MPASPSSPFALSRATVDRAAHLRSAEGTLSGALDDPATRVLELFGDRVAYDGDRETPSLRLRPPRPEDRNHLVLLLGRDDDGPVLAVVRPPEDDGDDTRSSLRSLGLALEDRDAGLLTTAFGLANWHAGQGFCPRCGARTEIGDAGWIRTCVQCERTQFPRTDPAVIMAVTDDQGRLLLARGPQWGPGRLSVLAGFVEPGESLEGAVAREVREEVDVPVVDVTYQGNQPWPFPASLMLAFTARATATALQRDPKEIAEARWVTREELAAEIAAGDLAVAGRLSIARFLIEQWFGGPIDAP